MEWLVAEQYAGARWLLTRLIGALYALAFANAAVQWRGLLAAGGLTPVADLLPRLDVRRSPTVFAWRYDDAWAVRMCWGGTALATLLAVGLVQQGPAWLSLLVWLVLWAAYLSVVSVGQIWYAFGWESILLEAGFVAAFLGSDGAAPTWPGLLMARWLVLRVELGAGLIKLRGDPCWRDLTCTQYHHETQPIPGPLSWRAHNLPRWWHRVEVGGNHVVQLVVPFGLLLPQPVAGAAAVLIAVTQGWLVLTGNFAWLNAITIVLVVSAVPDGWVDWLPGIGPTGDVPWWFAAAAVLAGVATIVLSWWPVRNMASSSQRMNVGFNPFHLVGSYGAFGSVSRTRDELVVEATLDEDPEEATWIPYRFKGKPGDPTRRPPQVAPWHLRLDWLMWFAALPGGGGVADRWLLRLVQGLLERRPHIEALVAEVPFDRPPRWIRVSRHRYRFTTPAERRATGRFWHTSARGVHLPPRSLGDPHR